MTTSKSWALVISGYSVLALAMLAFLTVNGVSATAAGTITTAGLIVLGFLLAAAGMLELARHMDPAHGTVRKGLVLQGLSLIGLLIGLVVSFAASSLPGHLVSAAFIGPAAAAGLAGAVLISRAARARQLIIGAALIALGAALIPAPSSPTWCWTPTRTSTRTSARHSPAAAAWWRRTRFLPFAAAA